MTDLPFSADNTYCVHELVDEIQLDYGARLFYSPDALRRTIKDNR